MTSKLKLIECTRGYTETSLGGQAYVFARDAFGRFTSDVVNLVHRALFLEVVHYREVDRVPAEMDSQLDQLEYDNPDDELGDGDDAEDENDGDTDAETDEDGAGEPETPPATIEPEKPEEPPVTPPAPDEALVAGEPNQPEPDAPEGEAAPEGETPAAPEGEADAEGETPAAPATPETPDAPEGSEAPATPAPAKRKKAS